MIGEGEIAFIIYSEALKLVSKKAAVRFSFGRQR
jgi:hypothetical protein